MPGVLERLFGNRTRRSGGNPQTVRRRVTYRPGRKRYGSDRVAIVGFHEKGFVIARPAEPHSAWLQERVGRLHTRLGGPTNLTDGLRTAVQVCEKTPPGILRRVWLLSDGYPNRDVEGIVAVVAAARRERINVNTIGFGDEFDGRLLRQISRCTHNGKFVPVRTMSQLSEALVQSRGRGSELHKRRHQAETTVVAIDLSASMRDVMDGKPKIQVVQEVMLQLLHYKQQCYS